MSSAFWNFPFQHPLWWRSFHVGRRGRASWTNHVHSCLEAYVWTQVISRAFSMTSMYNVFNLCPWGTQAHSVYLSSTYQTLDLGPWSCFRYQLWRAPVIWGAKERSQKQSTRASPQFPFCDASLKRAACYTRLCSPAGLMKPVPVFDLYLKRLLLYWLLASILY